MWLDSPWMHPAEVAVVTEYLRPGTLMLEWGAGGSTLHFSPLVGQLVSIEHDPSWYENVCAELNARKISNVALQLVVPNAPVPNPGPSRFADYRDYVTAPRSLAERFGLFDAVLIDGRCRPQCAEAVRPFLKSNAVLFFHDYYLPGRGYYHSSEKWYEVIAAVRDTPQTLAVLQVRKQ